MMMVVMRVMVVMRMMVVSVAKRASGCARVCHFLFHAFTGRFCLQFDGLEDLAMSQSIASFRMKTLLLHRMLHFIMSCFGLEVIVSHSFFCDLSDSEE